MLWGQILLFTLFCEYINLCDLGLKPFFKVVYAMGDLWWCIESNYFGQFSLRKEPNSFLALWLAPSTEHLIHFKAACFHSFFTQSPQCHKERLCSWRAFYYLNKANSHKSRALSTINVFSNCTLIVLSNCTLSLFYETVLENCTRELFSRTVL